MSWRSCRRARSRTDDSRRRCSSLSARRVRELPSIASRPHAHLVHRQTTATSSHQAAQCRRLVCPHPMLQPCSLWWKLTMSQASRARAHLSARRRVAAPRAARMDPARANPRVQAKSRPEVFPCNPLRASSSPKPPAARALTRRTNNFQ